MECALVHLAGLVCWVFSFFIPFHNTTPNMTISVEVAPHGEVITLNLFYMTAGLPNQHLSEM